MNIPVSSGISVELLNTFQASAKIFTDKACTKEVTNPVTLGGGDNVFYVKFASHDGSVADVYTATVTKPASSALISSALPNHAMPKLL